MRTFEFSLRIIKLCRHLEAKPGTVRTLSRQLLRAGTSVGANVEEAQAAQSRADFVNKNSIALKEASETHFWLRLIAASGLIADSRIAGLQAEADELKKILGPIIVSARKSLR